MESAMSANLSPSVKFKVVFPAAAIQARLQEELIEVVKIQAGLENRTLPDNSAAILTGPSTLDSLVVVEVLCVLDELLGFELSEDVVRAGGYETIADAIGHLMPRIEKKWRKRNGGGV
jgi:acyl carrier protein